MTRREAVWLAVRLACIAIVALCVFQVFSPTGSGDHRPWFAAIASVSALAAILLPWPFE